MAMKLSAFDFELPEGRIAEYPSEKRGESKLMVVNRKTGTIEHKMFGNFLDYFDDGDCIVLNNTKVFPARLFGHKEKTGAQIEVFLLRELNREQRLWDVLVDPARKIRVGNKLYFGDDDSLVAEVVDNTTSRGRTVRFFHPGDELEFKKALFSLGSTPLPKYIEREPEEIDKERYQTVYAKEEGAVAAPTAGLHFTEEMLKMLEIKGVDIAEVTLHTSLGTFRTIDVEDLSKHKMDAEYFRVPKEAVDTVNKTIARKGKVCTIGTTSMRSIESSVSASGKLKEEEGWTNLFIYPPYEFQVAECMLTNFHLPKSSLIIMVTAFGGHDLIMKAYQEAIKNDYRFYSYGDAMLII
jgi:S-adenosylmethionine:tRNA ribosyltransferase-isomerase